MPVSVAKFTRIRSFTAPTGCRTQAVRKVAGTPAIGAHIFCGNHRASLIHCSISKNIFGTDAADVIVRIMLSRSQPKKGIMMKSNLLNSLILAALAVPGVVMAADVETTSHKEDQHVIPPSEHTITANVGFFSNYLYRGISQTGAKPAIQGGFDYAHASGFYAGVWGSNVSWVPASSASLELDTYFGFKNSFATDFSYDVGFLRYNYPGVYPNPIATGFAKADTNEIYGLIGWKWVTLKYSRSLGDTFTVANASGSSYIDLSASYPIADTGVTLGAHYGKQTYKGSTADSLATLGYAADATATYSDYKLSVSKDFSGYTVGLAYSSTNANKGVGQFYNIGLADGSNIDLGKGTAVLSVTHSF